jgi:DNA-binding NtrC family response regulator
LQNVLERWAIICDSEEISMDESWLPREPARAPEPVSGALPQGRSDLLPEPAPDLPRNLRAHIEEAEWKLIGRALTEAGGNQSAAARRLGMSRGSLIVRLKRYGPRTA